MKVSALLSGETGGDAKLPTFHTLHYPPVGYFWENLVGMCHPVLKIPILFQTKTFIIHTCFQT